MNIKKRLFINLFISLLIILAVHILSFNAYAEQIAYHFSTVQSNDYANKSNTSKPVYSDHTTKGWLLKAIEICKKNAPVYIEQYWNWQWWIKDSTNCYAYAFDMTKNPITGEYFKKNFGLQPGLLSGILTGSDLFNGSPKSNALLVDIISMDMNKSGYVFIEARPDVTIPDGAYMVALSIFPGNKENMSDYHWYRLNSDGTWSHKPGFDYVTNVDRSGETITDPFKADRGHYVCFVGYFYVVKNI